MVLYPRAVSGSRHPDTVDFDHIKRHYYESHRWINPAGIVPRGPLVDFNEAPDRVLP